MLPCSRGTSPPGVSQEGTALSPVVTAVPPRASVVAAGGQFVQRPPLGGGLVSKPARQRAAVRTGRPLFYYILLSSFISL